MLSNPDMLHAGILPQHPRWAGFFTNLPVVVIDEMHVYRGVFGSHVANVLRRLRRICRFYGSDPQFFLASATIANPVRVAERLVEAPVTVIGPERDGAPQGEKEIVFYNPPLLDPALGIRRSSTLEAGDLAAHFLAHDVQTIVFARARLGTELDPDRLRKRDEEASRRQASAHASRSASIRGYRGGYLPASAARSNGAARGRRAGRRRDECAGVGHRYRRSSMRPCWRAIPARSPAPASRWAARAAGRAWRWACWWPRPTPSTST